MTNRKSEKDVNTTDPKTEALESDTPRPIVYLRPFVQGEVSNIPSDIATSASFSLHDENGRILALFNDRNTAIAIAEANNLQPLSVH